MTLYITNANYPYFLQGFKINENSAYHLYPDCELMLSDFVSDDGNFKFENTGVRPLYNTEAEAIKKSVFKLCSGCKQQQAQEAQGYIRSSLFELGTAERLYREENQEWAFYEYIAPALKPGMMSFGLWLHALICAFIADQQKEVEYCKANINELPLNPSQKKEFNQVLNLYQ